MKEASIYQFSWSIRQAAFLSGRSISAIQNLIYNNFLSEKEGEIIKEHSKSGVKTHYIITRKGMEKLTGYKFSNFDYFEFAKVLFEILKKEI